MLVTSEREAPMNHLQIQTNADYHRERLLREAEAERVANQVRSAAAAITAEPNQPAQRRTLFILWRRAATQTA
jgi:hypothetical protein